MANDLTNIPNCHGCEPNECSYKLRERKSLTGELKQGGCVLYYLDKILPNLAGYVRSLKLPTGAPLTTAPQKWEGFIGTAFDHCLRREYASEQPDRIVREGLRSMLSWDYLDDALDGLESKDPAVRALWSERLWDQGTAVNDIFLGITSEMPEERAVYSASADRQFRTIAAKWEGISLTPYANEQYELLTSGGSSLKQHLMDDLRRLMEIARENLVLNKPEFGTTFGLSSIWIGGADADIIDEGCLIDIKCTKSPKQTNFLRQVIGYALLDVDDEHRLDSVGIYLARQGIFWRVPLDDIARQAGATLQQLRENAPWGNPADREALRREIAEADGSDA